MTIEVQTWRRDNIDENALKNEFYKLGWKWAGQGGIANIAYLFTWNKDEDPVFPKGYEYKIIN